ncbi:hypothetical protein Tco_0159091 [Tanacetum coccineum]
MTYSHTSKGSWQEDFDFEANIRADLLFDDEHGVDCFHKASDLGTCSEIFATEALAAEEEHSTSSHSRATSSARDAQGTPTQSAAHSQGTVEVQGTASFHGTAEPQDTAEVQGTDTLQGTAAYQGTAHIKGKLSDSRGKTFLKLKQIIKAHKPKLKKLCSKFVSPVCLMLLSDLERKSEETEEVNIEEKEASNVKSGETEELDLETTQSTARQGTITPRTLNFEDEADQRFKHSWSHTISTSKPFKLLTEDKGKGILVEEPKKKKLTLQQIRALETTNDEEVARKNSKLKGMKARKKEEERKEEQARRDRRKKEKKNRREQKIIR